MDTKPKVLFLSVRNSVRGQMAEGFLRHIGGDRFIATSGGIDTAGDIDPVAASVMAEVGIDITTQHPKNVQEWFKEHFAYVISLADVAREKSPVFPFTPHLLHWNILDPTVADGSDAERIEAFRKTRDEIKNHVRSFLEDAAKLT